MQLQTLSIEEVRQIHEKLVEEFAISDNPIWPPGVKSENMLASAVFRQHTSIGETLKYPDVLENAATLTYGIVCDHPFHNGNKRTALVAMLVHLDRNKWSLLGVKEQELYRLVIDIANHEVCARTKLHSNKPDTDDEVNAITQWLKKRASKLKRGEKQITFRQLRRILIHFGFELANPNDNFIDIVKIKMCTNIFGNKKEYQHIGSTKYEGERQVLDIEQIKYVRKICRLREEDGVPSDSFYQQGDIMDTFVNQHRKALAKLANK